MDVHLTLSNFKIELDKLIKAKDRILIAFSGGMDSVCLLHLASQLVPKYEVFAVHINHGLRKSAELEEEFVIKFCNSLSIPLLVYRAVSFEERKGESVEMWARGIRQKKFAIAKKEFNADWILTAHHANDNLETILMHLDDGCGIGGLRGIPIQNRSIIRPLLSFSRKNISEYIGLHGLEYIEDSSNLDISIKRNFIRHKVVSQWEKEAKDLIQRFTSLSQKVVHATQRMDDIMKAFEKQMVNKGDQIIIENASVEILSANQKVRLVKYLIDQSENAWRRHNWLSLAQWISNANIGSIFKINENWSILKDRKQWILKNNLFQCDSFKLSLESVGDFSLSRDSSKEIIDRNSVKGKHLRLRRWEAGDLFQPLGMNGNKKVSDFLIDKKIDRFTKEKQLVVTADGEIIWVCGQRLSDKVKVTEETTKFLELSLKTQPSHI